MSTLDTSGLCDSIRSTAYWQTEPVRTGESVKTKGYLKIDSVMYAD